MTVTLAAPVWIDLTTVKLVATSDLGSPTFYWYKDGTQIEINTSGILTANVAPGTTPVYECLDSATEQPTAIHPGYITLGWPVDPDAVSYTIQEYYGGEWITRKTMTNIKYGFATWTSRYLEDETTHQFKITATDAAGNNSTAQTASILMVRNPDPPDVTFTYTQGTAKVTVAAS